MVSAAVASRGRALAHAAPGVALPEERYADAASRERILARLSSTPGTTGYRVG